MQTPLTKLLTVAAKKASHTVIRDFNEIDFLLGNPKAALDFAISSNIRAQENIQQDLLEFKKNYSFIFKNLNRIENKDQSNYFIVNGIIGMRNFSRGIPFFCISISLERDSKIFASVVYNPITGELFCAEEKCGSFYNNKRLKAPMHRIDNIGYNIVSTDSKYISNHKILNANARINNCKTIDLCYLASSKINDCIYMSPTPYYDIAPSLLIANEAGYAFDIEIEEDNNSKTVTYLANKPI